MTEYDRQEVRAADREEAERKGNSGIMTMVMITIRTMTDILTEMMGKRVRRGGNLVQMPMKRCQSIRLLGKNRVETVRCGFITARKLL